MVTPAHSEWSDHSNLVKTISGIVATPRFANQTTSAFTQRDATYFPNDKKPQEDPTIIAGTDEKINKEICANEGATPLGATLSGIPVFVRGINGQGREFLEFSTLLNESAGGVLLAIRKSLRLWSRVSLEIPSSQVLKSEKLRRVVRRLRARVIRITHVEGWNLCGLQFARPLV